MADRILARELVDYAQYDKLLEWQRIIPWINNFAQKKVKGTFNKAKAEKALGDYLAKDTLIKYAGKGAGVRLDKDTKLLFGKMMLTKMMPRITSTAKRMKTKGLIKGKLVKQHPSGRY